MLLAFKRNRFFYFGCGPKYAHSNKLIIIIEGMIAASCSRRERSLRCKMVLMREPPHMGLVKKRVITPPSKSSSRLWFMKESINQYMTAKTERYAIVTRILNTKLLRIAFSPSDNARLTRRAGSSPGRSRAEKLELLINFYSSTGGSSFFGNVFSNIKCPGGGVGLLKSPLAR